MIGDRQTKETRRFDAAFIEEQKNRGPCRKVSARSKIALLLSLVGRWMRGRGSESWDGPWQTTSLLGPSGESQLRSQCLPKTQYLRGERNSRRGELRQQPNAIPLYIPRPQAKKFRFRPIAACSPSRRRQCVAEPNTTQPIDPVLGAAPQSRVREGRQNLPSGRRQPMDPRDQHQTRQPEPVVLGSDGSHEALGSSKLQAPSRHGSGGHHESGTKLHGHNCPAAFRRSPVWWKSSRCRGCLAVQARMVASGRRLFPTLWDAGKVEDGSTEKPSPSFHHCG